jgi:3-phenylpropionate/trans-cinnamate dioxygenase ferredoxin reductase component
VIATGARARILPGADRPGVYALRTLDDARRVRAALNTARHVVVVGGGFIGCEVASAARSHGLSCTVIEAGEVPLAAALGPQVATWAAQLHHDHGTALLTEATVTGFEGEEHVSAVLLADGRRIPADLVVYGIGVEPNVEWVAGADLDSEGGIRCDASGRAHPNGRIHAVGDVARWWHRLLGRAVRIEHWAHAAEQAEVVGAHIATGTPNELTSVPYVWSDQYGTKIQIVGLPQSTHQVHLLEGTPEQGRFLAAYTQFGRITAAVAFSLPRQAARCRTLVARSATVPEACRELGIPALTTEGART